MLRKILGAVFLTVLLSAGATAQTQDDYLDVGVVNVRPEKRAEFDAVTKKMADANRRHGGDTWIAMEVIYGEQNAIYLISTRPNYAAMDKGYEAFFGAMNKAFGQAGTTKLFQDFNNCVVSLRGEVRRRRWDLSANPPADAAAMAKRLGESRWVRTTIVQVRPGRVLDFEAQLKRVKDALEKGNSNWAPLVSQSSAGQQGTVFYISWLGSSLGSFDNIPLLSQVLGAEGFKAYMERNADLVQGSETIISHFLPELSNPPEGVAAAASDFWKPKPAPAKPKAAEAAKPGAAEKK